jgi:glycosyltransferase involved in cell wall biosynthesis
MDYKISLIVPYFNESSTIVKTLNLLKSQTYLPKEILLINSSSTDDTYNKINIWIKKKNLKHLFKNINSKSKNPSSSKNLGIINSKHNWLAFMDCGLFFKKNWLLTQVNFLKHNFDIKILMGLCSMESNNILDRCFISQTWGYATLTPVIPSSLIHKSVFKKIGYFENRRAGYDRIWLKKAKLTEHYTINRKCIIKYFKTVHANNILDYVKKIFSYSSASYGLKNFYNPYLYFFFFLISLTVVINNSSNIFYIFFFYIFFRGYLFPFLKSSKIIFFFKNPILFVYLPFIGFLTDISRLLGYFFGIFRSINNNSYTN